MAVKDSFHNRRLGIRGEKLAAKYLVRDGWKIVERNYKSPFGEIDIIAKKGDIYAFTEVKTRLSDAYGSPSQAVNSERKQRYIMGANYYFAGREIDFTVRFDVIEVYKDKINRIENAFY